jgi:hypothetical protein
VQARLTIDNTRDSWLARGIMAQTPPGPGTSGKVRDQPVSAAHKCWRTGGNARRSIWANRRRCRCAPFRPPRPASRRNTAPRCGRGFWAGTAGRMVSRP